MKLVVTGAFGFIGSNLVEALNRRGIVPYVIDKWKVDDPKWKNVRGLSFIRVDESEVGSLALPGEKLVVVALGASVDTREGMSEALWENNVESVIRLSRHADKFIYASSGATYGLEENDFTERVMGLRAANPYAQTKLALDDYFYGKDKTYGLRFFNCYDEKTEILTERGFVSIKDVTTDDKVATLNPNNDHIEYHFPNKIHKIKHVGKMIHFDSKRIDILCTPEQNLYIDKRANGNYELVEAQQVIEDNLYQAQIKGTAKWVGKIKDYEVIPETTMTDGRKMKSCQEKKIPMDKWLSFLGWFLSEGSVFSGNGNKNGKYKNTYYRVNISQLRNAAYIEEIYQLAKDLGFNPQRTITGPKKGRIPSSITIHSKQLYQHLVKFSEHKYIPRELLELDSSLLEHLFVSLMKGDGHVNGKRYTTKYSDFADQFQELLFKTGRYGRKTSNEENIYRIQIPNQKNPQLGNCGRQEVNFKEVDWNDYVYDVTVTNHIIFLRRNGIGYWSGNCFGPREFHKGDMASLVTKGLLKQSPLYADGQWHLFKHPSGLPITRDFVFVGDVVKAIIHFIDTNGLKSGVYNIGSGESISFESLVKAVEDLPIEYVDLPDALRGQYQRVTKANLTKLREVAGYKDPLLTLEEGIEKTREWLKVNG